VQRGAEVEVQESDRCSLKLGDVWRRSHGLSIGRFGTVNDVLLSKRCAEIKWTRVTAVQMI
jgi:hypothetical protein